MIEYKGYVGKIEVDEEADFLYGEVINTRDVITFQGRNIAETKKAFYESVEDYLAFCAQRGESPEKPYSGKFVVRLPVELHRKASIHAKLKDESLNSWLKEVVETALKDD
jgi:predicted HicB family RNase H-like nuclease